MTDERTQDELPLLGLHVTMRGGDADDTGGVVKQSLRVRYLGGN